MRLRKSIINIGGTTHTVVRMFSLNTSDETIIIHVNAPHKTIIYKNRKESKLLNDTLEIEVFPKSHDYIFVVNSDSSDFSFDLNGINYGTKDVRNNLTPEDIFTLLYAFAYEEYKKGNSSKTLDILTKSLMDKYLSKYVINAFTNTERQKCSDILFAAMHNRKLQVEPKRFGNSRLYEGQLPINDILQPHPCILELLDVFEKNGDKYIPISENKYKRIRKKYKDHFNMFKRDDNAEVITDFKNLVFNKENLNISFRYKIPGTVIINPKQAKSVGFNTNIFNAHIYREQTLIKDGELNIDSFNMLASKATLNYLNSIDVENLYTIINDKNYNLDNYVPIKLNIYKLPVLADKYCHINDSLEYIINCVYNQHLAECKQKVLKYYISNIHKQSIKANSTYTKEQLSLLNDYGIDNFGVYHAIDNKPIPSNLEKHEYKFFEFYIKGFSKLPKIDELLKKILGGTILNTPETIMKDYIYALQEKKLLVSLDTLEELLKEQKSIILYNTKILAKIKFIKVLTGGWWEGLVIGSKDNFTYNSNGKTLVIRRYKKTTY